MNKDDINRFLEETIFQSEEDAASAYQICQMALNSQWHPYDKDDDKTWPDGSTDVLVYGKRQGYSGYSLDTTEKRTIGNYNYLDAWDDIGATHWMPIITPPQEETDK